MENTITLYRPVGPKELELIRQSGFCSFPPRLPEQPIFYPVLNEEYATQIARAWNVKESGAGFVTRFAVCKNFLNRYTCKRSAVQFTKSTGFLRRTWTNSTETLLARLKSLLNIADKNGNARAFVRSA